MSDVNKTAIFTLKLDKGSWDSEVVAATRGLEALNAEMEQYKQKQKQGIALTDEEIVTMKKLQGAINAHNAELKSLVAIQQKKNEADLAQKGSIKELNALYAAAEKELKRLGGTVEKTVTGELKLTNAQNEQNAELLQAFNTLKDYDAQLGKHQLNVGNYGGVLSKLKQQIKELEQQRSIANSPDEVLRLTNEIRKAQFEFDKYTGKVDALGNRVAKNDIKDGFQDAAGAAQALTGGIGLLSLAMGDNSKAGETLQKVMIGITAAQTALTIARSREDVAQTAAILKTKLLTAAQWAYNNAVAAFGIGALITGLTILAAKLFQAKQKTDELHQSGADLYEQEKKLKQLYDDGASGLVERNRELERQLRLAEAQEKSDIEILGLKRKIIQEQIEGIDAVNNENASFEKRIELDEQRKDLLVELDILDIEYEKTQKERVKTTKEQTDATILLTEAEKRYLNLKTTGMLETYGGVNRILDEIIVKEAGRTRSTAEAAREQMLLNDQIAKENQLRDETALKLEENKNKIYELSDVFSNAFQAAAEENADAQKEFFKNSLIALIDYLEKVVMAEKVKALVGQLAEKGPLGIVTGALVVGLIEGVFATFKSKISGFAEGGLILPEHGLPIARDNGDNRLATVKTGEVIMNEHQQQGLKAVAGADIFRRLRIPGFATGGMVLGDGGFTSRATVSKANQSIELRNAMREALQSMPPIYTEVTEITRAQDNYRKAELVARL